MIMMTMITTTIMKMMIAGMERVGKPKTPGIGGVPTTINVRKGAAVNATGIESLKELINRTAI